MAKGDNFRKYDSTEKFDAQFNMRINSEVLDKFRERVDNPQEWMRVQIRRFLFTEEKQDYKRQNCFLCQKKFRKSEDFLSDGSFAYFTQKGTAVFPICQNCYKFK